jgi:hypothetical protein
MSEFLTHAARALPVAAEAVSAVWAIIGVVGIGGLFGLAAVLIATGGRLDVTT